MSRISHLLNASADVWRASLTDDGGGGQIETWSLVATERARFAQPSARERLAQRADQERAELSHVVYLRHSADVRTGDELRTQNATLFVVAVFQPSMPGTYLRADCTARQHDTGGA